MLLSIRHNFLFVHIAKTGGTSVRAALTPLRWRDPYQWAQFVCSRLSAFSGHRIGAKFPRHAKAIAAREMLPRAFYDGLFKFAIVRNPWDRQVSSWHHIQRERPHVLAGVEDFETFLRWKFDPQRPPAYIADTSVEPQADSVIDLHGGMIVDFIGRYENLQDDFRTVCERIGIEHKPLPHRRQARDRAGFRGYYTDATAEFIAQRFSADIDRFGYSFDD